MAADLSSLLGGVLSDPKVLETLGRVLKPSPAAAPTEAAPTEAAPTTSAPQSALPEAKPLPAADSEAEKSRALLTALAPYLSEKRRGRLPLVLTALAVLPRPERGERKIP